MAKKAEKPVTADVTLVRNMSNSHCLQETADSAYFNLVREIGWMGHDARFNGWEQPTPMEWIADYGVDCANNMDRYVYNRDTVTKHSRQKEDGTWESNAEVMQSEDPRRGLASNGFDRMMKTAFRAISWEEFMGVLSEQGFKPRIDDTIKARAYTAYVNGFNRFKASKEKETAQAGGDMRKVVSIDEKMIKSKFI